MKRFNLFFPCLATLFSLLLNTTSANACTEIKLNYKNHYMVGQNFDWGDKYAFIAINPAGIQRQSTDLKNNGKPLQWVSKYGSATLDMANQHKHIDTNAVPGGMNQYGLVASVLWLEHSQFPQKISKPELGSAQWVQYLLDNARTVAEAIQLTQNIEIEPTLYRPGQKTLVHLFVHDAAGNSAVMEYLNGKLTLYQGKNLPVPVLANNRYENSITSLKQYKNFGGHLPLPAGYLTRTRFVLAANLLQTLPKPTSDQQAIAFTFNALGYLIEPPVSTTPTVWSVVYDLSNKTLYYRNIDNAQIRFMHLRDFNFSKGQPTKALLLNNNLSGNVEKYFRILSAHGKTDN